MKFWNIFARRERAEPVAPLAPVATARRSKSGPAVAQLNVSFTKAERSELNDCLALVLARHPNVTTKAAAVLFLARSFRAYDERRNQSDVVVPIRKTPAQNIADAAQSLPAVPKVTLAARAEVAKRIATCRKVLDGRADMPRALVRQWEYALTANERILTLIDSGLPLHNCKAHGVLVDNRHYYRPGQGKARMSGSREYVLMDVHQFIAEAGRSA